MSYRVGALAIPGALLAATYMLRLLQKMAWGEPSSVPGMHGAKDLNLREWVYLVPLALMVLYLGLAPGLTLRAIDPSLTQTLSRIEELKQHNTTTAIALNIDNKENK
jgi:NADH-quinone oxidoreductase subunit M